MTKEDIQRYSKSEKWLKRAEKTIPLGAQTFSKSKTQFPIGVSPFFASHANGALLYDIDGNEYIDFINSLASVTLGYNDPDVTREVQKQLKKGTIFSLSTTLECEVSELICAMVPCAEMVRFGKNGTDATSAAIRLARAYTNKEHIAVCGYHGWQDWYIGSTSRDLGIPESTKALTHTFKYNDISSLQSIFNKHPKKIAGIILEPMNITEPKDDFLQKVQEIAKRNNCVLIFDETITGFRYANGGAQEYFNVTPDLATFGKGIANGYPLSAIVGKKDIMMLMEEIFFSGTFSGETLSLAAAKVVLNKLKEKPIVKKIWETGNLLQNELGELIKQKKLKNIFSVTGLAPWSFLQIADSRNSSSLELKTLLLQEMFGKGILTLGSHNISYAHTKLHINVLMKAYEHYFDKVLKGLSNNSISNMLNCSKLETLFKVR
ncbi:aspartate aminotransferase family protein [Candidatus Marinamargulisbacteria bacterium SCGC AG-343-D04]|nr:aspartate aminotransferase family protein [Candidatus Marinamargulisbacteria bacterium SCGC AG-343-D04]